jgi:predicted NUDIX family NTP pyrophosphohydrolase
MARTSAGVLLYRIAPGDIVEVLIVHPGGPFWAKKDLGVWSVPKGEYEEGEDPAVAADREFAEELGSPPPAGPRLDLGELTQRGGKRVRVFAVEGDLDVTTAESNTFEMEWPPGSKRVVAFPEIDRAAWVTVAGARRWMLQSQAAFLDRLLASLERSGRAGLVEGEGAAGPAG